MFGGITDICADLWQSHSHPVYVEDLGHLNLQKVTFSWCDQGKGTISEPLKWQAGYRVI